MHNDTYYRVERWDDILGAWMVTSDDVESESAARNCIDWRKADDKTEQGTEGHYRIVHVIAC